MDKTYFVILMILQTVPSGVTLTTALDPTTSTNIKPVGVFLSVDWEGSMVLTGSFRVCISFSPITLVLTLVQSSTSKSPDLLPPQAP